MNFSDDWTVLLIFYSVLAGKVSSRFEFCQN